MISEFSQPDRNLDNPALFHPSTSLDSLWPLTLQKPYAMPFSIEISPSTYSLSVKQAWTPPPQKKEDWYSSKQAVYVYRGDKAETKQPVRGIHQAKKIAGKAHKVYEIGLVPPKLIDQHHKSRFPCLFHSVSIKTAESKCESNQKTHSSFCWNIHLAFSVWAHF